MKKLNFKIFLDLVFLYFIKYLKSYNKTIPQSPPTTECMYIRTTSYYHLGIEDI